MIKDQSDRRKMMARNSTNSKYAEPLRVAVRNAKYYVSTRPLQRSHYISAELVVVGVNGGAFVNIGFT
jgi:hypothetical protein